MIEPSWIGDDGLKYRTYCEDCEQHHEGDCEQGNPAAYDEYDMWREAQNDIRDGLV